MRQRNEPADTRGARQGEAWTPVAESELTGPPLGIPGLAQNR
jgi:hypothetical protein